jgi:hypothetical protein
LKIIHFQERLSEDIAISRRLSGEQHRVEHPQYWRKSSGLAELVGQRLVGGNMRTLVVGSMALAVVLAASNTCIAQVIVKQEPMEGQLRTGVTVLVDDGSCGRGKIKLITSTGGDVMKGLPQRTRTCISSQAASR